MERNKLERVVFYSKADMAAGPNLIRTETLLNNINLNANLNIVDLLELYHIKLYFDNDLYLLSWDEETKDKYKSLIDQAWVIIKNFWLSINDSNILYIMETLDYNYKRSFWDLISYFQVYKNISKPVFINLLNEFSFQVTYILANKNLVTYFDKEVRGFLMTYKKAAELLLSRIEEKQTSDRDEYFFPVSLILADRETILDRYLDDPQANLNYIRLIEKSKDSPQLKLSPKIKLKAKRKSAELNNRIMEDGYTWKEGVRIAIDKDQSDPVKFSRNDGILEVSYSEEYLNSQTADISLFQVFKQLFCYLDDSALITLVSKESELDVMERIMMHSKNEYLTGEVFQRKSLLSHLQLIIYDDYLKRRDLNLETIIESVITGYFQKMFGIGLKFKFPSKTASYLEKIRTLSPDFEFLLRQYHAYVTDGEIDLELLQISSSPLWFSDIKSLVTKKYAYSDNDQIQHLKFLFFSDQSPLHYVEPFENKHGTLYDLLTNEDVNIENFANYQKTRIEQLIADDYLMLDNGRYVRIKKTFILFIIGQLHKDKVISYWHYPKAIRLTIDEMAEDNLITFDNTLFSKEELNFFNFYLNKKEFTNGYDLRNKYLHGTNGALEEEHKAEYYMLLKVIILALLKIEDDILLKQEETTGTLD